MAKTVKVTRESGTGRNLDFRDDRTGATMTRAQFVAAIRRDEFPDYHVRMINGVATPVSNPDRSASNNLD